MLAPLVDIANRHSNQQALGPVGANLAIIVPYTSGGALTPGQVVKFDATDGVVVQSDAETDLHIGIYVGDDSALTDDIVPICVLGICKALAGASITRGAKLTGETTTGRVDTAAANEQIIGIALANAADGELVQILVVPSRVGDVT
jgi:hypothetical protein